MKYLIHYIEKKKLFFVFSLITFQQVLNAFGTYALAKAGLSFEDRPRFIAWIITSILLFIFSPFVNIFIRRMESQLSFDAYKIFIKENLFTKGGNSAMWQNKSLKDQFLTSIGSDASDYLGLVLFVGMDLYSFSLSVILSVLTLSFTIDMALLPAFITSGILSFFMYKIFSRKVETLYSADQSSRINLGSHILKSWDNVLLNNVGILKKYQDIFQFKVSAAQSASMRASTGSELLVFSLGLATGLPVLASVCWILWRSSTDTQLLVALIATLPRQLNILAIFRNIFHSLTNLISVQAKFDIIMQGTVMPERKLQDSINTNLITLNQKVVQCLKSTTEELAQNPKGRFEVRGPNGAGKSTLLLHLNHKLAASVYLPTHPNLMISDDQSANYSSGESLLAHIEVLAQSSEPVILLDEWDANLDAENQLKVNERINQLALSKTVIEVRHR